MTQIRNIDEANHILSAYIPRSRELLGKDLSLERMQPMLDRLDHPENKLKIIHVAGTSGKTSTTYYIASLLREAGQLVGHTVSPHVDSVTERVQINLKPISDEFFCRELGEFLSLIEGVKPDPTYFELMIAFVYWYFAKAGVDYAVIETGLGGSLDSTNVAGKSDKICVITDIGLDHMHVLGNTLTEIAGQKAGIIHAGNQAFMYGQSPAVLSAIQNQIEKQTATLNVLSNFDELSREVDIQQFKALPQFQQRNWLLASEVYKYIAGRDSLPSLTEDELAQSMTVQVPGRMDRQTINGKTVIMDGAHNEQKMTAFVTSFQKLYPDQKADILISLKEGKEYKTVLPLLKPICSQLIVTAFKKAQDLPSVSTDPERLAEEAKKLGFANVSVKPDYAIAYRDLLALPEKLAIVTGSFYLLSAVRATAKNKKSVIRFIAAIDGKRGIANENGIPWDLPTDKAYFRSKTRNGVVVMGYATYAELDEPLPNRRNLVATVKNEKLRAGFEAVTYAKDFLNKSQDDVWVIGGAGLFDSTLDQADELYLTQLYKDFNCTKFFPEFEDKFDRVSSTEPKSENGITFSFQVWKPKRRA